MNAPVNLAALEAPAGSQRGAPPQPGIRAGFASVESYELLVRMARVLTASDMVPTTFREQIVTYRRDGSVKSQVSNPKGLANCVVALNLALRMNADPIMVMQNLVPVEGKFSWSSQWVISMVEASGKFSTDLRFRVRPLGRKVIEHIETYWEDNERKTRKTPVTIDDVECIAWVKDKAGEVVEGPAITIELAVKEGWYTRAGSKWQTMPDMMLRYRAASWFGRLYIPALLAGLRTIDEEIDMLTVDVDTEGNVRSVTEETLVRSAGAPVPPAEEVGAPPAQAEASSPVPEPTPAPPPAALTHDEPNTLPLFGAGQREAAPAATGTGRDAEAQRREAEPERQPDQGRFTVRIQNSKQPEDVELIMEDLRAYPPGSVKDKLIWDCERAIKALRNSARPENPAPPVAAPAASRGPVARTGRRPGAVD